MFLYSVVRRHPTTIQYHSDLDSASNAARVEAILSGRDTAVTRHMVANSLTGKVLAIALLNNDGWAVDESIAYTAVAPKGWFSLLMRLLS